jgi:hypothetical protein
MLNLDNLSLVGSLGDVKLWLASFLKGLGHLKTGIKCIVVAFLVLGVH